MKRKILVILSSTVILPFVVKANSVGAPLSFYSADLFTDVSGGWTITANMDKALKSRDRIRFGVGAMDAKTTVLGKGTNINFGFGTDPDRALSFTTGWDYWRFPGNISGNYFEALIMDGSVTQASQRYMITMEPVVRALHFVKALPLPANETIVASAGLRLSNTFYITERTSIGVGGEESRYEGDPTTMQIIFKLLRASGNAPFISSLVQSRYYLEYAYAFPGSTLTFGFDQTKTVLDPNKFAPSLYVNFDHTLSDAWGIQGSLGTTRLDTDGWFASVGFTYFH
jgi:hypothetical protein